jgi:hypothetical protein
MSNVDGAFIHGCKASIGTGVFLHVEGENTREIVLSSNYLARAKQPTCLADNVPPDVQVD